jgi:hypothetical protein
MKHSKEEVKAFFETQRRHYANGLLTSKQIADLEAIPGWTWEPGTQESINQQVDFLIDQKQEDGRLSGTETDLGLSE